MSRVLPVMRDIAGLVLRVAPYPDDAVCASGPYPVMLSVPLTE